MEDWGQFVDIETFSTQTKENYHNKLNEVWYYMFKVMLIIFIMYILCKHIKYIL
jgi:SNF family Na+-dependent transporter